MKKFFPSLIHYSTESHVINPDFQWFMTPEKQIIGIEKSELTQKEIAILTTLLEPYSPSFPIKTDKEQKWLEIIHETKTPSKKIAASYRFVYFHISSKQIDPITFKEALNELFAQEVVILWENEKEGMIIEEYEKVEEIISFEQIIDILMSDINVNIHFLVGPFQHNLQAANSHYKNMMKGGHVTFKYSDKNVLTFPEAVPFILMDQADPEFKEHLTTQILQEFKTDKEFFKTLDMFLQCNLNISNTAKKLYMHRNTLQYRLDRFKERTGIDVRNFHQALTVYLVLIAHRNL
ncbi:MAG TPA: helix-turn-helix domain-containing protein [Candidatus Avamphibacillus sp.]|nr:helix-turn-helix domain-containing protein [Candidatus Avamphibacillus sp.]